MDQSIARAISNELCIYMHFIVLCRAGAGQTGKFYLLLFCYILAELEKAVIKVGASLKRDYVCTNN